MCYCDAKYCNYGYYYSHLLFWRENERLISLDDWNVMGLVTVFHRCAAVCACVSLYDLGKQINHKISVPYKEIIRSLVLMKHRNNPCRHINNNIFYLYGAFQVTFILQYLHLERNKWVDFQCPLSFPRDYWESLLRVNTYRRTRWEGRGKGWKMKDCREGNKQKDHQNIRDSKWENWENKIKHRNGEKERGRQ